MSVSATKPAEQPSGRKALDAQYVNSCMKSAMRALADVEKRRAWGNSKSGSPVATVALCQEIARLNIERESVIEILHAMFSMADEEIAVRFRTSSHKTEEQIAGKSVIYSVLSLTRNMARTALAKIRSGAGEGGIGTMVMAEWQPIETAPKDGTAIWVLLDGQPFLGYCEPANTVFNQSEKWFVKASFRRRRRDQKLPDQIFGTNGHGVHPSHWMPLPDSPAPSTGAPV